MWKRWNRTQEEVEEVEEKDAIIIDVEERRRSVI